LHSGKCCLLCAQRSRVIVFKRQIQQYFSYIVAVSFIGRENRGTRRKTQTCRKSLTRSHHERPPYVHKSVPFSTGIRIRVALHAL